MESTQPLQFFDSHGNLWETCSCDHQEAENFGPRYCARRLPEGPDWKEASSRGWVTKIGEWDVLVSDRGV